MLIYISSCYICVSDNEIERNKSTFESLTLSVNRLQDISVGCSLNSAFKVCAATLCISFSSLFWFDRVFFLHLI